MTPNYLNVKEFEERLDSIIEQSLLTDEEQSEYFWISSLYSHTLSMDELYMQLIKQLIYWSFWRTKLEKAQNFELCAKLKKVVALEISEFKQALFSSHDQDIQEAAIEEAKIKEIQELIHDEFNL